MLAALLIYYWGIDHSLLSTFQLNSLLNLAAPFVIVGYAQTVVILTGGIDLSVGSVTGLANVVAATTFAANATAGNTAHAVLLALAVGIGAGFLNGAVVAWGRLPPIIVTLATLSVWEGVSLHVLPAPGGQAPVSFTSFFTDSTGFVPNSFFLIALVTFAMWLLLRRTSTGRTIYAVGDDEGAAYTTGIHVIRAKLVAYMLSGLLAAIAGLFLTALTSSGDPLGSQGYTLNSVAAVVIGGTSLLGGVGGVWGTLAGGGILAVVTALLPFANISSFWQGIFSGVILVVALALRSALSALVQSQ